MNTGVFALPVSLAPLAPPSIVRVDSGLEEAAPSVPESGMNLACMQSMHTNATMPRAADNPSAAREMLNKVPAVKLFFWVIKILCTTVGETAADFLNTRLHLGLTGTTCVMAGLLAVALFVQMRHRNHVPSLYWVTVVLISVVGTLITDTLTDNLGVSLVLTTIVFAVALALTFAGWYAKERTLSVHTITTSRREAFYWLAILFTFALGTAAGDLTAERFGIGYLVSALLFAGMIAVVTFVRFRWKVNATVSFWIAYILTRPLGASLGDYLSQPYKTGGLNLGTVGTSALFLALILGFVIYLTVSRRDLVPAEDRTEAGR